MLTVGILDPGASPGGSTTYSGWRLFILATSSKIIFFFFFCLLLAVLRF
jgi:hypothetical protein